MTSEKETENRFLVLVGHRLTSLFLGPPVSPLAPLHFAQIPWKLSESTSYGTNDSSAEAFPTTSLLFNLTHTIPSRLPVVLLVVSPTYPYLCRYSVSVQVCSFEELIYFCLRYSSPRIGQWRLLTIYISSVVLIV
jgi:hypothetical protein